MIHRIGADEVGIGAICGPITVCAFMAPSDWTHGGVKDSKKFSNPAARELVAKMLRQDKESWYSLVSVEADEIDEIGYSAAIEKAHCTAIMRCVEMLLPRDRFEIIIDGNLKYPLEVPYRSAPKADATYVHVGAASILAKQHRDAVMHQHAKTWPVYGFDAHAGYGTAQHMLALKKFGACPIHRRSVRPVREL